MTAGLPRTSNRIARLLSLATAREAIAVVVAAGLSLAIIATIYTNIRSVEQALPEYGFKSFRELHVHIRDIDRLRSVVQLARANPDNPEARALLLEAADLVYIRFAKVDRTDISAAHGTYPQIKATALGVVGRVDEILATPGPLDAASLAAIGEDLTGVDTELNRLYFRIGEDSTSGLHKAQSALGTLNSQVLAILAVLSTLLIGVAVLLVQRYRVSKTLRHIAWHDSVTGLKNRAWLMEKSAKLVLDAQSSGRHLGLYLIDLDHFKQINDTFGHQAGDDLLRSVAKTLKSNNIKRRATSVRLGGDEFAFLRQANSTDELSEFGEELSRKLSGFRMVDGHHVRLGASVGLSVFPDHGSDVPTLLQNADLALYAAKSAGRQRSAIFTPALKSNLDNRMLMEENIRKTMRTDAFALHWQPVLSVPDGRVVGAEALLRWSDPASGKVLNAAEFIPIAEQSDLIVDVDKMVIDIACRTVAAWRPQLPRGFISGVNISGMSLNDPGLLAHLEQVLNVTSLPPEAMALELTERTLNRDLQTANNAFAGFRELGVHIALDDFGTGYSDFSTISELKVDWIKIDHALLRNVSQSHREGAVLKSVLGLCAALEADTVVKGVENPGQLEFLAQAGCRFAQGHAFSEPIPTSLFTGYLKSLGYWKNSVEQASSKVHSV